MSVLDVATGAVTKIHDSLPQPGTPTWSPDGKRDRARRRRAADRALPRRHQPGADDRRRPAATIEVVRADADAVDRLARRRRSGVVARRHEDGGDLRRRARRCGRWRATGEPLGPPRRVTIRERALAELGRAIRGTSSISRSTQLRIVDIETGETRDGAARPDVDAGDPDDARRRPRRQARST